MLEVVPFPKSQKIESAKALLYAHMAMSGTELPEGTLEAVRNHSVAYDDDPEAWEENRNDTLAFVTEKTMDRLRAVHAFAAIDQLKGEFNEEAAAKINDYIFTPPE